MSKNENLHIIEEKKKEKKNYFRELFSRFELNTLQIVISHQSFIKTQNEDHTLVILRIETSKKCVKHVS